VRILFGWLSFLLAAAFTGCLVFTLIITTWFGFPAWNGLAGFFGFGIPMVLAAFGAVVLSDDNAQLQKWLGWTSTTVGLACGVTLLILVAGWVMSDNRPNQPGIAHFFGFGITMVSCGGFGIVTLFRSEGKKIPSGI